MSGSVSITPPDALAKLSAGLAAYQKVAGKEASAVLLQKGAQVIFGNKNSRYGNSFSGLVQLFSRQRPADGAIYEAAKNRGFALGTKQSRGALSATAYARASRMMGGYESVLATGSGRPDDPLSFSRVNKKGRSVRFRHGRTSYAVSGDFVGPLRSGQKRLNFRAVATYFELRLREAGRGFLGAGFLFKRWQKLAQSDPRRQELGTHRILVNQNPRSSLALLGDAELSGDDTAGNVSLRITSYVPGTREIGDSRNLFSQVIGSINADIGVYLARKVREAAVASIAAGKAA